MNTIITCIARVENIFLTHVVPYKVNLIFIVRFLYGYLRPRELFYCHAVQTFILNSYYGQ